MLTMVASPVADMALQRCRAHIKNGNLRLRHRPIRVGPRLLLWRIQETPVGTRSNVARFSGVSRTIHSKTR